jgi:hypothetical protein
MSGNQIRIMSIILGGLTAFVGVLQQDNIAASFPIQYQGLVIAILGALNAALHAIPDAKPNPLLGSKQ